MNMNTIDKVIKGIKKITNGKDVLYDFNGMGSNCGTYKITSNKLFMKGLVKLILNGKRNHPLVSKVYKDSYIGLVIDLDIVIKGNVESNKNILKKEFMDRNNVKDLVLNIRKIVRGLFINNRELVDCVIEKNVSNENIHLIYNKIWGLNTDLVLICEYIINELKKMMDYKEKCEIVDLLKSKTLRNSLFNKGNNGIDDYYTEYDLDFNEYIKKETEEDIRSYLENNIMNSKININFNKKKTLESFVMSEDFDTFKENKEIIKVEKKKKVLNTYEKVDYDFNFVSNDKRKKLCLTIMKGFSKNFFDDYNYIIGLMIILTKEGFSVNEINEIIKDNIVNVSSKYYNNIKQIEDIRKNMDSNEYSWNFGSLIYWIKNDNIEYFENHCCKDFKNLKNEEKEIVDTNEILEYENKYKKMEGDEVFVFNSEFYKFMKNRSFFKLVDSYINRETVDEEDDFRVDKTNYNLLMNYIKKHFIRLRYGTEYLVKGYEETEDEEDIKRVIWEIQKKVNNEDLCFNNVLYIGEKDEVISFYNKEKNKKMKYKGKLIIYEEKGIWNKVLRDINFNSYLKYKYRPFGINENFKNNKDYFNTFNGFGYKQYEGLEVKEENIETMKLFLEYLFKCCCMSRMDIFEYFLKWISDIVKNPRRKNGICFVFYSKEKGVGKGKIGGDFLGKFLGQSNCLFGTIDKLLTRFSNNGDKTILSVYDELNRESFDKKNYNKLKNLITETKGEKEKKGVDCVRSLDWNKYILLTNELDFLKVESDENRFCILNFLKLTMKEFMRYKLMLEEVLEKNIYMKLFGEIIENIDITKMKTRDDWTTLRPVSELDNLVKQTDIVEDFLKDTLKRVNNNNYDFVLEKNILTIGKNNLYMNFKNYFNDKNNSENKSFSEGTFLRTFRSICLKSDYIEKVGRGRKEIITVNINKLVKDFVKRFIMKEDEWDEEDFKLYINGEDELSKKELSKLKRENKKLLKKFKKENDTIINEEAKEIINVENKVVESVELFNNFIVELYGETIEKPKIIVKKTKKVIKKKVIKKKVIKKKVIKTEIIETIIDEDGLEIISFNNICML